MPPKSHEIVPHIPVRTRPSILIAGAAIALGALLGTGATVQAAAEEAQQRAAAEMVETQEQRIEQERAEELQQKKAAQAKAAQVLAAATPVLAAAEGKTDASALARSVTWLSQHATVAPAAVTTLAAQVEQTIPAVQVAVAEAERIIAERATPAGAQAYASELMGQRYGWGADQASCLVSLWQKESNWRWDAVNASSGATGIPQSLPGSKMASHGADWQTNPATQISWGLDYIQRAYGTPCGAWAKSQAVGWY